jgi:hypothetical protein
LAQVLRDEIGTLVDVERDLKLGLQIGPVRRLELQEVGGWLQNQITRASRLIESGGKLLNVGFAEAAGPPGMPGNPEFIVYVARRLGKICRELVQWIVNFSEVEVHREFELAFSLISNFTRDALDKFRSIPSIFDQAMNEAEEAKRRGEEFARNVELKLTNPMTPELKEELGRLTTLVERGALSQRRM